MFFVLGACASLTSNIDIRLLLAYFCSRKLYILSTFNTCCLKVEKYPSKSGGLPLTPAFRIIYILDQGWVLFTLNLLFLWQHWMRMSLTQSRSTWFHQKLLSQKISLNGGLCPRCTTSSKTTLTSRDYRWGLGELCSFSQHLRISTSQKTQENCCWHWIAVFFSIPLTELLQSSSTVLPLSSKAVLQDQSFPTPRTQALSAEEPWWDGAIPPPAPPWHLLAGGQPAMAELAMAAELFPHSTSQRVRDSNSPSGERHEDRFP